MSADTRTRCIALRRVRYKDSRAVVTLLTRERGLVSAAVSDGGGRETARRRSLMMPGVPFEASVSVRGGSALATLREVEHGGGPTPVADGVSGAIALFFCDLLCGVLRSDEPDRRLFDFVERAFSEIYSSRQRGNLVPAMIVGLMDVMGVLPDVGTWTEGRFFDFSGGCFRQTPPLQGRWLDRDESRVVARLLRITFENRARFRFTHGERRRLLDGMMEYMAGQFGSLGAMRSLEVVRAMFD